MRGEDKKRKFLYNPVISKCSVRLRRTVFTGVTTFWEIIKPDPRNPSVTGGYDRNIGGTNPGKDSVLAGGSGRSAPEASAGISLFMVKSLNLRRRRRKASALPHPRRNQRIMVPSGLDWPPGHGCPWPLRRTFPPPTLATHP